MSSATPPGRPTLPSPDSGAVRSPIRIPRLTVVHAPAPPVRTSIILDDRPLALGREPGDDGLALPDDEVSRTHAVIDREGAGWSVVDRGSRNGTFVDGARVDGAPLVHGTVIRLGRSILVVTDAVIEPDQALAPETPSLRGPSLALSRVRGDIGLCAPRDVAVLIRGETGVGKERVAEEIHRLSGRRGAHVSVNCAAISPSLAESELFGHVGGAFTGARGASHGLFAAADGGTLFLDEVGELPLDLQPKLLRALAVGEIRPVGGSENRRVDVRVVAATHRDLPAACQAGDFRADLLARLSGWTLVVPPLRERRDDVLALAAGFLAAAAEGAQLSPGAAEALVLHDWPANVRELEQAVAFAAARCGGARTIRVEHLPPAIAAAVSRRTPRAPDATAPPPLDLVVPRDATPSPAELERVLAHHGGSVARVAAYFGKDRKQVYRWLERAGIDPAAHRERSDGGE